MSVSEPHIIRLRGPWEFTLLTGPRAGEQGPFTMEGDWRAALASAAGPLRLTRLFNAPTGIEADTSVLVVLDGFPEQTAVFLDDAPLLPLTPHHYEISGRLARRHCLAVDIPGVAHLAPPGEVRLEIRAPEEPCAT